MKSPTKKIGLILVFVVILPALFFAVYEIATLNESEKVIEGIYSSQLEAILYSVNQYSEDAVSAWSYKIDRMIRPGGSAPEQEQVREFLSNNRSVRMIIISDTIGIEGSRIYNQQNADIEAELRQNDSLKEVLRNIVKENSGDIRHLYAYKKEGYRKILPLKEEGSSKNAFLVFLAERSDGRNQFCLFVLDPSLFVRQVLAPRIQQAARNEFLIAVADSTIKDRFVYSNIRMNSTFLNARKALWLLPGYYLGISLRGQTIEDLVRGRTYTNIAVIASLIGVLLIGVYFVLRSIRREIDLAQTKSDFVSNVSHELRTPLALISMFAETLEMGRVRTEEKKQEYYSIISREAGRLGKIVNKILNFSRIEAGKVKYNFTRTDINELIDSICSAYSFHMKNNGFDLLIDKKEDLPLILADGEAVSEAVINLIDNAMKYSNSEKYIKVATGMDKDMVFVEVTDKGMGISSDKQKKIFEKFYRITSGEVHNSKGTGLGLTIVRHIVEAHKGKIELTSRPEKGSTFRLLFPAGETKL